jgi:hypothetical protein
MNAAPHENRRKVSPMQLPLKTMEQMRASSSSQAEFSHGL